MNTFINIIKFNSKVGKVLAISSFLVFASLLVILPRQASVTKAEGCAVYSQPVFNPFPVTWLTDPGVGCNDFATLAGGVHNSGNPWSDNFSANAGDTVTLRVYVHNGAATNSGSVMHGVRYNVNLDTNTGSSHTISAQLTADNAAEKDGSITINTPANAHLELVNGELNHYIGDKQPCFDFSESFFITIKVVANVSNPNPTSGNITATHDTFCASNGTVNGNVSWTSSPEVTSVKVTVYLNGVTTQIGTSQPSGSVSTSWLVPGSSYIFTLYDQNNKQIGITTENIDVTCGGSNPVQPSASLSVSSATQLSGQCLWTATVSWSADNVQNPSVYVIDPRTGISKIFAQRGNGNFTQDVPWLNPGYVYHFQLTGDNIQTIDKTVDTSSFSCGQAVNSEVTLSLNSSVFCVYSKGEKPNDPVIYTVKGSSDLYGQQIVWSSTKNGASTGESNAYYGQNLNGDGFWTGRPSGLTWFVNDIGSWTKTVAIYANGKIAATSGAFAFTVKDCSTTVTPPANSNVSLTLNSSVFCVYSKGEKTNDTPTYSVTGSSDLVGQQIIWSSTKNGASTGESNAYYGQNLNNSNPPTWSGSASRSWGVDDIGSWTKTAAIYANGKIAATSGAFAFTVKDCSGGSPAPSTVSLSITNFCVGAIPVYTVTGSSDLAGQQIIWSSTKNGVSTGEVNANYNGTGITQVLNSNGYWSGPASRAWLSSDVGSWVKTVGILKNGSIVATAPFSFTVQNCGGGTTTLFCSANVSTANVGDDVLFTATGGNGNYTWATSNNSSAGTGSLFRVSFASSGSKNITVTSSDGQTANCGVAINSQASGGYIYNNCVNNSCNNSYSYNYNNPTPSYNYPVYANTYVPPVIYNPVPQVLGSSVNLQYSKRAINETKNADATSVNASREDFITYTLTVTNNGSSPANSFIITDDLSAVLPYADMVDNGGGSLNGNVLSYQGVTIPAGGSVSESFKVRVKYSLSDTLSYVMTNTYGNTVTIHINNPQVLGAFIAPKTGADTNAFIFAGLLTISAVVFKKRRELSRIIFT